MTEVRLFDAEQARAVLDVVNDLYAEVYAEPPYLEGPDDVSDFAALWHTRLQKDRFRLGIAYDGRQPVGFAFGFATRPGWWDGLLEPAPAGVTDEPPGRSWSLIELAVLKPWRNRGIGRLLHNALVGGRSEERVVLLCRPEPEAAPAQAAYASWGYERVGPLRPFEGAPVYDAMVLAVTRG